MLIEVDNQGDVNLENTWSVGGRKLNDEVFQYFLRELKVQELLLVKWCPGEKNESYLFNKKFGVSDFERNTKVFCNDY